MLLGWGNRWAGNWGNLAGPRAAPGIKLLYKNPLDFFKGNLVREKGKTAAGIRQKMKKVKTVAGIRQKMKKSEHRRRHPFTNEKVKTAAGICQTIKSENTKRHPSTKRKR